jgi:hypothetical protein
MPYINLNDLDKKFQLTKREKEDLERAMWREIKSHHPKFFQGLNTRLFGVINALQKRRKRLDRAPLAKELLHQEVSRRLLEVLKTDLPSKK